MDWWTSPVFHSEENVQVAKEALTIDVIAARIGVSQSLITRIGILSILGALLEGSDAIMHSMSFFSMEFSMNCSDKGCCLGRKYRNSR